MTITVSFLVLVTGVYNKSSIYTPDLEWSELIGVSE